MSDETQLAPCPFCGGPAIASTVMLAGKDRGTVACVECPACIWIAGSAAEAIAAWNRRAGHTGLTASIEAAKV